jgi:IS5 family transposase
MVALDMTFREAEDEVPSLGLPWEEPCPDHTTIHRAFQELPEGYLESLLEGSASKCLRERGWRRGLVAADGTGVDTDRYEEVARPLKRKRAFEWVRQMLCLKLHIVAILDLLVILKATVTKENAGEVPVLRELLEGLAKLPGSVFDADRGYDAEAVFRRVYELSMFPNIKQRAIQEGPKGRGHARLRYRSRAAKGFDVMVYHHRGLIEGIFGAEEVKGHRLRTRFRKRGCQERWGLILCIAWNVKVWNRIRCAKELGMEVKPIISN